MLQETDKKYRNLAERLNSVVYSFDPKTLVATYINRGIERLYGYTVEEWLQDRTLWETSVHPDDKGRVLAQCREAQDKAQDVILEYRIIRKDKAILWVEDHLFWEKDPQGRIVSGNGVTYDITKRKQAEEELRQYRKNLEDLVEKRTVELAEANEQLKRELSDRRQAEEALARSNGEWEKTFNAISDWVCLVDLDARILRTNVAGENFVRVPADEMFDQKCCKLLHGSDQPIAGCPLEKMLETHQRETVELQVPDESWLMVTADPVTNKEGQLVGAVHITRDVTDRKRSEEALRESEERFRKAFDHAALGMVLVSPEGRFLKVNSYFSQMLGYPE